MGYEKDDHSTMPEELFKGYSIETVETVYTAGGGNKKKRVTELLIMNYKFSGN
jgi:hypothetical protein